VAALPLVALFGHTASPFARNTEAVISEISNSRNSVTKAAQSVYNASIVTIAKQFVCLSQPDEPIDFNKLMLQRAFRHAVTLTLSSVDGTIN
jgi:hypothetical protein